MTKPTVSFKKNDFLEHAMLVIAIIEPLSSVPQIIKIYTSKDAHSLSLLSCILYMATSILWLVYAIRLKNLPLIASSAMWSASEAILIIGILLY